MSTAENNYRKLEIGFLESVPVRFNTQSYIKKRDVHKNASCSERKQLLSDWSLDYLTLQFSTAIKNAYLP